MHANNMSDELKVAIEAARIGGKFALKYFGKALQTGEKIDNTVISAVDEPTEQIIKQTIKLKFPDAKFVGEETGGAPTKGKFWTIDPIDGTRHFIRSTPLWSVLISLIIDGEPVIGVSNAPCLNEIVYAQKGIGAFINGRKMTVSKFSEIKESILILGSLRFFGEKISAVLKLISLCASTRSFVSPYEFHLIASGRCEIILDAYGKIWDIAPFKIIIEEAGGMVTNWDGKPWTINDKGCIATNRFVHSKVMEIIKRSP